MQQDNHYIDKCKSCNYYTEAIPKPKCKLTGHNTFPSKPKCRKYDISIIKRPLDYSKVKRCSECEYSNNQGICKFYMYYAHLKNGCIKEVQL